MAFAVVAALGGKIQTLVAAVFHARSHDLDALKPHIAHQRVICFTFFGKLRFHKERLHAAVNLAATAVHFPRRSQRTLHLIGGSAIFVRFLSPVRLPIL